MTLEQVPHADALVPHAPWRPRRRLFEHSQDSSGNTKGGGLLEDRGRLVHDAVLLGLEAQLPQEGLTTPVLLDWARDPEFGWPHPHCEHHVAWAPLAAACREAVIVEGRGARVSLPPFAAGIPEASSLRAIVHLSSGASCRIYREDALPVDGAIAVLSCTTGKEVEEVRYRDDESVQVVLAGDGGRIVKRPRDGLVFHEEVGSATRHARHGPRPAVPGVAGCSRMRPPHAGGAVFEASEGLNAETWLRKQGSKGKPTAWVQAVASAAAVASPEQGQNQGQGLKVSVLHTRLEPAAHLAQRGTAAQAVLLSPPPGHGGHTALPTTPRWSPAPPQPALKTAGRMLTRAQA